MLRPSRSANNADHTPPPFCRAPRNAGPPLILAAATAIFLAAVLFAAQEKAAPAKPEAQKPAEEAKPAEYVGSETCQACHEDVFKAFQKNPHHRVENDKKRGWEGKACESCHGPGSKHAESTSAGDILNPAKQRPDQANRSCLKCHLNQPTHVGRIHGGHARNQVACNSCHSIHKGQENLQPRRAAVVNEQCSSCHSAVWAEFQRPYKHRLPEGAMSCTDCHNPHGSFLPRSIRPVAANEPGCLKCHGDKRGPFTFEHPPLRLEGCRACHEPHGSANPRMLNRAEVRFLCLVGMISLFALTRCLLS